MDFVELIRSRRMVRRYAEGGQIPHRQLTELLDLARRSPSAGHTQGWDFLVLRTAEDRDLFWALTTDHEAPENSDQLNRELPGPTPQNTQKGWLDGMRTAPVLVLCLSDPQRYLDRYAEPDKGWTDRDPNRWTAPYWDVDTGIAVFVLHAAAVDAGLASCLFGVPHERVDALREGFAVPADRRPVAVISLGRPAPDRRSPSLRRGRRPRGEVVHDGRFGRPWPDPDL